jgi:hypothetical protein
VGGTTNDGSSTVGVGVTVGVHPTSNAETAIRVMVFFKNLIQLPPYNDITEQALILLSKKAAKNTHFAVRPRGKCPAANHCGIYAIISYECELVKQAFPLFKQAI